MKDLTPQMTVVLAPSPQPPPPQLHPLLLQQVFIPKVDDKKNSLSYIEAPTILMDQFGNIESECYPQNYANNVDEVSLIL